MDPLRMLSRKDMIRCVLCHNAPCTEACGRQDAAALLRSIWFYDPSGAAARLPAGEICAHCGAPCQAACVREVPIRRVLQQLEPFRPGASVLSAEDEALLRCDLCGFTLENPFLLSSSVVGSTFEMCDRAFEAGWAGVAFKTVSLMDVHGASPRFTAIYGDNGTIIGFKNIEQLSDHSLTENLDIFRKLKEKWPQK